MAWSRASKGHAVNIEYKDAWTMEENIRKKRKLDKECLKDTSKGKDDWDDSLELTQADLETLDVIASQAITDDAPVGADVEDHHPAEEVTIANEMSFFAKPSFTPHTFARRSTSSSSNSSAHPASLSSRSASDTSGSLSSHLSENGPESVQALRSKLELEIKKSEEEKFRSRGELTYLRESLRKQEEELERVRAERDAGIEREMATHRDSERAFKVKIDNLESQAQFRDREFKTLQEQYQALQQRLRNVEQGGQKSSMGTPGSPTVRSVSPKKVPVKQSPPSKQRLKQLAETDNQGKYFPTRDTFMKQVQVSPSASPSKAQETSVAPVAAGTTTLSMNLKRNKRLKLRTATPEGVGHPTVGGQVVQHLLKCPPLDSPATTHHQSPEGWNPGLLGLLHAMSTTVTMAGLTFNRCGVKGSSSPVSLKPSRQALRKQKKDEVNSKSEVVSRENFQLAVDGLLQLLEDKYTKPGINNTSDRLSCMYLGDGGRTSFHSGAGDSANKPTSGTDEGLLSVDALTLSTTMLLPLLTDYTQSYVDLLNSPLTPKHGSGANLNRSQHPSVSPHPSTSDSCPPANTTLLPSSSSLESSSLDNSVTSGPHASSHIHVARLEAHTATSLRVCSLLLRLCPPLAGYILAPSQARGQGGHTRAGVSSTSGGNSSSAAEGDGKSETEADDEKSTSSSEIRILGLTREQTLTSSTVSGRRAAVQNPVLYHLLLQIAAQDMNQDSICSPDVLAQSLHILALLSRSSTSNNASKLESIVTRGILTNCLRQTTHVNVLVCAVRLLTTVTHHVTLSSRLCSKSENCPLYLMHRINTNKQLSWQHKVVVYSKEYIVCVSSIVAEQKHGLQLLLSNNCPCSQELVPGIVLSLYSVYKTYQQLAKDKSIKQPTQSEREECSSMLWTLGQGISLLHAVAQADCAFVQHHSPVQLQYVSLLSGIRGVLKSTPGWDFHLSALDELCDFEPDLSDLSQGSECEDRMDQS